jgi:hypothetical protein
MVVSSPCDEATGELQCIVGILPLTSEVIWARSASRVASRVPQLGGIECCLYQSHLPVFSSTKQPVP